MRFSLYFDSLILLGISQVLRCASALPAADGSGTTLGSTTNQFKSETFEDLLRSGSEEFEKEFRPSKIDKVFAYFQPNLIPPKLLKLSILFRLRGEDYTIRKVVDVGSEWELVPGTLPAFAVVPFEPMDILITLEQAAQLVSSQGAPQGLWSSLRVFRVTDRTKGLYVGEIAYEFIQPHKRPSQDVACLVGSRSRRIKCSYSIEDEVDSGFLHENITERSVEIL